MIDDDGADAAEESADKGASEIVLHMRAVYDAPAPRRIRLDIPGWAGSAVERGDGVAPQPWHCQPFVEGATYGLELVYPFKSETRVSTRDGVITFEGDVAAEMEADGQANPFGVFAAGHYGMATALDLLPPPGYALRLGPHPRFFTDLAGDVPLALPGHLQRFWPQKFFAVFRAPPPGAVHVFRPGEPYAQLLVVPVAATYRVEPMPALVAEQRTGQERTSRLYTYFLAKRIWKSDTGHVFDDMYKQLARLFRRGGDEAVRARLQEVEDMVSKRRPPGA